MYRDVEGTERAVFDCVFLLAYRRGVRVFLGSSRNSIVALSIYVLGMHIVHKSASIMGYCVCWVVSDWFVCIVIWKVCLNFGERVSCVHNTNTSPLAHGLITVDW